MTRLTATAPSRHTDADVLAVAEGLTRLAGTDVAAEQLQRIYGERRVIEVLGSAMEPTAAPDPAAPCDRGPILRLAHPRQRLSSSRAYGPRPRAGGRRVYWL